MASKRKKRAAVARGPYRKYTVKQRKAALSDADKLGLLAAAEQHGIPITTLKNWWKRKAGLSSVAAKASPVEASPSATVKPSSSRVAKSYTPSEKAQVLEHAASEGVTAAHKKFDVSRFTIYDWQRKVRLATEGKGESPTSGPDPEQIEAQRDQEILGEWHRHPGLGPSQIKNQLRRRGIKVSVQTARRVMEEAGYRPPKVKRQGHDERFEAVRPKVLWTQSSTCGSP